MNTRALVGILLAGFASTAAAQTGDFHWTGKLAPGKRLEIKGVNGDVRATAATDDQITVIAHKHARRSDPDDVKIEVVPFEGGVTICAVYPTPRRAREENDCAPGDSWHSNTEDNDTQVDFTVSVPKGVEFDGQTVNGEASAEGLTANVTLGTVNGGIQLSTTGYAEARTVNGSIVATMGRADWTGPVEFTTVNGGITLNLPATLNTDVRAETLNGDIDSDFPMTVSGKFGPRRVRATIGSGGRTLELKTVNGSIKLRKNA
jgi:hypothetical protein